MRTHSSIRNSMRLVSCFGLLGAFIFSACTSPEASPAPADPPNETHTVSPDYTEEEPDHEEEKEKSLVVSNGSKTDVLAAQAASAPFDKTYLIPEGIEVLSTNEALTFIASEDNENTFQATVSTQALPTDYNLALRRDYTSLSLRSEESEPNEVELDLFSELHFDYYLTVEDEYGIVHRLVQFDEKNNYMYVASLTLNDSADIGQEAYEEIVSLFHAILISGNSDAMETKPISEEDEALSLSEKLEDRSIRQPEEDPHAATETGQLTASIDGTSVEFPIEQFELFETLSISLPEGYQMRTLGAQSYSFTHSEDPDFEPITLIIGQAHPDIPMNLHVNALRSSSTELVSDDFPALHWYDYTFAEENSDGSYNGLTLIKELDDGRILDLAVRSNDEEIQPDVLAKMIASLSSIEP
ncbi:hypothetical protein [Shouchella patagoniensis]|uniref:hypothetical protein n=1 Tax=Shouchella patagoniensis TaxID=228576 RepID=UPI000995883C|nr:hypothetical protein [Shouchella patagoniensis]